jgi:hypothetical protein
MTDLLDCIKTARAIVPLLLSVAACGEDVTAPVPQGKIQVEVSTGYLVSLAGLRAPIVSNGQRPAPYTGPSLDLNGRSLTYIGE